MNARLTRLLTTFARCALASLALGCERTLAVLGPATESRDAAIALDAGTTRAGCEACAVDQLCAFDRCVGATGYSALASQFQHSCAVEDGRLFCWGENDNGELGLGDQAQHLRRTRVGSFNDWLSVSVGEHHSCALRAPGRLYCWGANAAGQLALGDTASRNQPTATAAMDFRELYCGGDNCCALGADAALYCWGDNLEGKIGQADRPGAADATRPLRVSGGMRFIAVAVGQGHVCAVSDDGGLYCWGRNSNYELGLGTSAPEQTRMPTPVGDAHDWQTVAASQHHTCGTRQSGALYCWGGNEFFELASELPAKSSDPLRVGSDSDWADVGAGWFHSCGQKRDGRLFCWGRAIEGQLGQGGGDNPIATPTLVATPAHWKRMTLGNFTTCGIDDSDALYCWGKNDGAELGLGDSMRRFTPVLVP